MIASSPRHEMEVRVRLGAMSDGTIRAIDLHTLSNTGAFGEHGPTTVGLSGHKSIPMYHTEAFRFQYEVVYTNRMSAGAAVTVPHRVFLRWSPQSINWQTDFPWIRSCFARRI